MADYNFSGVDALSAPEAPPPTASTTSQPAFDFSGVDSLKDYETPMQIAKTGLEGLASGATLGLSKKLETATGMATPEDIAGRENANPWTSGIGNVVGTGAMLAGTGGLGGLLPEGAGIAARIGAMGIEGATIGGVTRATDDWSQNKPLDAEKIAASAGIGALFGLGGAALLEAPGLASKGLGYFDALKRNMTDFGSDQSWFSNLRDAYSLEGNTNPDGFINNLTDNLGALYKQAKKATEEMYDHASNFYLKNALEDMPVQEAQNLAGQAIDKIESLTTSLPEGEEAISNFQSPGTAKIIGEKIDSLRTDLANAETSMDVHTALTDFATDLDKGIKFDKLPTASQQVDQDILQNVRQTIRGDLKNPELWKDAAPVFKNLSDHYSEYMIARKNFQRDFMKNRIGANGKTEKVIDPGKVKSFFNNADDPSQRLKHESLESFLTSAHNNAKFSGAHEAFQDSMRSIVKELTDTDTNISGFENATEILKKLKAGAKGHEAGVSDLVIIEGLMEFLPKPLAASVLALKRWTGEGSGARAGMDLYNTVNAARQLAEHAGNATAKIEKGAKAIFLGSSKRKDD